MPKGRTAAVVLNVTVTQPTTAGHLTLYPYGQERPLASNVNFTPGETVPNLVIVPLGHEEYVQIYNRYGYVHVVIDVVGWFDLPGDRIEMSGLSTFGSEVAIDSTSTYAYISRPGANRVEVMRLADGAFEDPILVGSSPTGLDLTPDGKLLYVANTGSVFVSVVDVATRTGLRRFPVPSGSVSDRPYSIAVLANGKALITTTFNGSGMGGRLHQVDLATDTVTPRTDFSGTGALTEASVIRASGDRMSAVVVEGDSSNGSVLRYDATTDTIADVESGEYIDSVAVNHDGSVSLVNGGGLVYDEDLNLLGSMTGCGEWGTAINAAGTMGYGLDYDMDDDLAIVAFCDPVRFRVTKKYSVGAAFDVGRLLLSPDGTTLVGITDSGVLRFRL